MNDITIVILAGGKSSRMGEDKGLMSLNGKPMIKHIIDTVKELDLDSIIISNDKKYECFGIPVFEDIFKDIGPLGGIHAGFENTQTSKILILSCDMPYINKNIINYILKNSKLNNIVITKHGKNIHPLIGIYDKNIVNKLLESIRDKKLKAIDLAKELKCYILDLTKKFDNTLFHNINSKNDLYPIVKIKLYGMISECMKQTEMKILLPNNEKLNLRKYFDKKWPILQNITYAIAINQELREEINKKEKPNEISILPPFAGG